MASGLGFEKGLMTHFLIAFTAADIYTSVANC
jgi:hypothetical protein